MADMMTQACIHLQKMLYMYGLSEMQKQQDAMAKNQKREQAKHRPANTPAAEKDTTAAAAPAPAPDTPPEIGSTAAKIERSPLNKLDVDDSSARCGNCGSTIIQRVPGGGKRCGQCGQQWGQASIVKPATTSFGLGAAFRK